MRSLAWFISVRDRPRGDGVPRPGDGLQGADGFVMLQCAGSRNPAREARSNRHPDRATPHER
jgi:hypothetical protein